MSRHEAPQADGVGEIYDAMAELVDVMGGNIHVGYWENDDDRTPVIEAIDRFTDVVAATLDLQPGQRLLDVGCGVGVPAIRIAQRTDATVTGVTISNWQVGEATRRIEAAGLRGQITVHHGDAEALAFADGAFDAVLAFESLAHAADRGQWMREMARVVRPGGRVVFADFVERVPLTGEEADVVLAASTRPPPPAAEFADIARASGLYVDDVVDCGEQTRRSFPAYVDRLARMRQELVAAMGQEMVDAHEQAMRRLVPVYRDKIGYAIVICHRPR